jgi:hypothetical protein
LTHHIQKRYTARRTFSQIEMRGVNRRRGEDHGLFLRLHEAVLRRFPLLGAARFLGGGVQSHFL